MYNFILYVKVHILIVITSFGRTDVINVNVKIRVKISHTKYTK